MPDMLNEILKERIAQLIYENEAQWYNEEYIRFDRQLSSVREYYYTLAQAVIDYVSMTSLQNTIGAWGDETFEGATITNVIDHLKEEVEEVAEDNVNLQDETADITILAMQIAHKAGFSLEAAVREKFARNLLRSWKKNDKGYWNHEETDGNT